MGKYVLCKPLGGWNDLLCQIAKCWLYAEKTGRILLVDTKSSGIHDTFSNYFSKIDAEDSARLDFSREDYSELVSMTFFPNFLEDLSAIAMNGPLHRSSGQRVTFDFSVDYKEQVLVHHSDGGGLESLEALKRLVLNVDIAHIVRDTLKSVGNPFIGVHVRNTDYRSDYISFLKEIFKEYSGKKIYIASDDPDSIRFARELFGIENVFNSFVPPEVKSQNALLYSSHGYAKQLEYNRAALIDLFVLSKAEKIFSSPIHSYKDIRVKPGTISGFALLSQALLGHESVRKNLGYD